MLEKHCEYRKVSEPSWKSLMKVFFQANKAAAA